MEAMQEDEPPTKRGKKKMLKQMVPYILPSKYFCPALAHTHALLCLAEDTGLVAGATTP